MSRPLRVLHIAANAHPDGGVGRYLQALVAAQRERGSEVHVAARSHAGAALPLDGPWPSVDVVHVHEHVPGLRLPAIPVVRTLHNHDYGCSSGNRYLGEGKACLRHHGPACVTHWPRCAHTLRFDRLIRSYRDTGAARQEALQAATVLVHSQFVLETALRNGLAPERLKRLPLPVERFDVPGLEYVKSEPSSLLFVGRLSRSKGLDVLLEALGRLPEAKLEVAGDGWQRQDLERAAQRHAAGRVRFSGWLSGPVLAAAYSRASVVVMPNRWPEPFGLVGLEAMWAGRPVVASLSGGVTEWLDDGVTGLAVPPGEPAPLAAALRSLFTSRSVAAELGRAGRERAEAWDDYQAHAARLEGEVYALAV